jgi:hypothetical protein
MISHIYLCPEALVIRNAGGRAMDAIRSLEVMGTIGNIHLIVIIHHEGPVLPSHPSSSPLLIEF